MKSALPFRKPTPAEIRAAKGKTLPDVVKKNLAVLFAGINPGLYTAAIGHHFGRPGNRFWPALHRSGLTDRLLSPHQEKELLKRGIGITNVVPWATATANELSGRDFERGCAILLAKVRRLTPKILAVLGMGAYRRAFHDSRAKMGLQDRRIGKTRVWVFPNPSGLNANYQMPDFVKLFRRLRIHVPTD